jgi:hypothetical protein
MSARSKRKSWGGARPGAGRPKLPPGERQGEAFLVRMRPTEVAALRDLAADAGTTVGVYAREVLRRSIRRSFNR